MLVLKIIINNTTYKLLNDLVISNYFLINIFDEGICITQNLSSSSNISVFIDKKYLDLHQVLQEKSLVCESLDLLKNFEVTYDDGYKLNGKAKIVNDCCNTCKLLKDIEFPNIEINFDQLNLNDKIKSLEKNKFNILISEKFNGILLKTNYLNLVIYINIISS